MSGFDKLKEAAEEIKLDDLQKQKILEACKGKKRRKINYAALAAVAAMLIVTVAVFSPGFLLKAGAPESSDMAENEAAIEDIIIADEDFDLFSDSSAQKDDSVNAENGDGKYVYTADEYTQVIFDAGEFRNIYSVIPQTFIKLVDHTEFTEWKNAVTSDNGMAIVQFVEHFGVSKEAFDEANRNYARYINGFYGTSPLYRTPFKENEPYEIFNTELIYSADREMIDEYYTAFPERESGAGSMSAEIIVPENYYK